MAKKPARNRTQTLSLRTSPATRYALEKSSVYMRQSMTEVIERSLSVMMKQAEFDIPEWVDPIEDEQTITLQRIVNLTWHESETVRILRTAILAPALLSSEEAYVAVGFFNITPDQYKKGADSGFWGSDDPFEGIKMSDAYYKNPPLFDIKKCESLIDKMREGSELSTIDLGLAFRGGLGDMRRLKAITITK